MNKHMHMHIYVHIYIYMYISTYVDIYLYPYVHTDIHIHTHTDVHIYIYAYTYTNLPQDLLVTLRHFFIRSFMFAHGCFYVYNTHSYINACIHRYMNTYLQTYKHTHFHSFTHAHTQTHRHTERHRYIWFAYLPTSQQLLPVLWNPKFEMIRPRTPDLGLGGAPLQATLSIEEDFGNEARLRDGGLRGWAPW